ncbi:MAG TPA: tRNA 2-selenouridine(34) synthase MnmH [Ignavibacteria bacterium]|nr:tRNA 2-selenouridine(34) synthase MnmH [Ignavibacteria bacterium]
MISFNTPKELFDFIRTIDVSNLPELKSLMSNYPIQKLNIDELLLKLKNKSQDLLLIDTRSEKEFEESAIPFSVNFPVLTNTERHNVGLVYKNYSQTSALWLAMQYADPKKEDLKKFLENNGASEKEIIVNCWRGGGRSAYLSKMISDIGYKVSILSGGYKAYRMKVNNFFSWKTFPGELLELSGLTGCGKSELLQSVAYELPVIDLEYAAKHFSSLLGHIPYQITNHSPVKNQTAFENNIFSQIYFNSKTHDNKQNYFIESESRRIGYFEMPKIIFDKLKGAKTIRIICSLENRVKRIVRDYFGEDLRGIEPMIKVLSDKQAFFKQQLSSKKFDDLLIMLENKKVYEFSETMITDYYDLKYTDKGKTPVAEIHLNDIEAAKKELKDIYFKYSNIF